MIDMLLLLHFHWIFNGFITQSHIQEYMTGHRARTGGGGRL